MIITLKGADFSASNIGKITTWNISAVVGNGATYNGVTVVDRDPVVGLSATVTIVNGFAADVEGISVVMGGAIQSNVFTVSEDNKTVTISIPAITGHVIINVPTIVVPVDLTLTNVTETNTTQTVNTTQTIGAEITYGNAGTLGIVIWDIPAYALVTLTAASGGTYGIALTDSDNIVVEYTTNAAIHTANSDGIYTFAVQTVPTRLHVSRAKFVSATYRILTEDEIKEMSFTINVKQTEATKYVAQKKLQTVGSPIVYADMTSSGVCASDPIPENTQVSVIVKSGGVYGIALCDTNGNVLEAKNNADADENLLLVFAPQAVSTVLYASKPKFTSASYKYV